MKNSKKIFIIDPDVENQKELFALLSEKGRDIEIAGGISEAIDRIVKVRFECIIVDENLKDINGHKVVSIIKTISPGSRIIMTSSVNTKDLEAKIRRQDVFYYHIKSFDINELKMAVQNALKKDERR